VRRRTWLAWGLVAVIASVYAGTAHGPWVFDDWASIPDNPTLRHWRTALFPPASGITVTGRPILNLSFALDYALGGGRVEIFHATNLAIHLLAALTLFGLIVRLGESPLCRQPASDYAAALIAALWAVHPLQTESVSYLVQRAESLAGLFYLLTAYWFVRGRFALCVAACGLGMATKETVATAPIFLLLLDRTFLAGSFREAWRLRSRVYGALAATWGLLAGLIIASGDRGGTAGLGLGLHAALIYARAQFPAILHYLGLAFWPHPLVFDYGTEWRHVGWTAIPCALGILGLVGLSLLALRRRWLAGFLGFSFFLLIAPSSSVVPIATEQMAEHRLYLPLAALIAAVVLLGERLIRSRALAASLALILLLAASFATVVRNRLYQDPIALWQDTVKERPQNVSAHINLGFLLFSARRYSESIREDDAAVALEPDNAKALTNRGRSKAELQLFPEAQADFAAAIRADAGYAEAHNNLGVMLAIAGQRTQARREFETALRLHPDYPEARRNLDRLQQPAR